MELEDGKPDLDMSQGFWYTKGDSLRSLQTIAERLKDVVREPVSSDIPPIRGLDKTPLVSMQEAIEPLLELVPNIQSCLDQASRYTNLLHKLPDDITEDEFKILLLCLWPWEDLEEKTSLYHVLNTKLRQKDRGELKPYLPLLKLLLTSLYNLPNYKGSVWCGTRQDVTPLYKEGQSVVWWGFSSFTDRLRVINSSSFLGKYGIKTLFNMKATKGFRVNMSDIVTEIMIPPGLLVKVKNIYNATDGVKIVELQEMVPEIGLIDFPHAVYELGSEEYFLKRLEEFADCGDIKKFLVTLQTLPWNRQAYLYTNAFQTFHHIMNNNTEVIIEKEAKRVLTELILSVMKFHTGQSSVQETGCLTLTKIKAVDYRDSKLGEDVLRALIMAVREHVNDRKVQLAASPILLAFLNNYRSRASVSNDGLIPVTIQVMIKHQTDNQVVENTLTVLSLLAINAENREIIGLGDGIKTIVQCLNIQADNETLLEQGFLLLSRLSTISENQPKIRGEGGIETVITAIKKHETHSGVQQNGCLALARVSNGNVTNQETIGLHGGIEAILGTMSKHTAHRLIQKNACLALANLAGNVNNGLTISKNNGIEVLLQVMEDHDDVGCVQKACCEALATLCKTLSADDVDTKRKCTIAYTKAMVRHFDHRGVQSSGSRALLEIWDCGNQSDMKLSSDDTAAIEALLRTVTCHYDHADTQKHGFLALAKISQTSQGLNLIQNGHGMTIAISALSAQVDRPGAQHAILSFLSTCAKNEECRDTIAQNGGIDVVAFSMVGRPYHLATQICGSVILCELSANRGNHKLLSQTLVTEALTNARINHPNSTQIHRNTKKFFQRMGVQNRCVSTK